MRHGKKILKIGRTASHRKATLQSMSAALIQHKRITTTLGKARALRVYVEPILNRAKDDSTGSRRQAFRHLQNKEAVKELYGSVAEAIGGRPGGYTRIVKLGQRGGDAAEMAIVEIVDFNDIKPEGAAGTKRKTRRSRVRSGVATTGAAAAKAGAKASAPAAEPKAAPVEDEPMMDEPAVEETPVAETADEGSTGDAAPADAVETPEAEADAVPESQPAEAVATDATTPEAAGNPQVPPHGDDHPDAEQGAPTQTGEPGPGADATNMGRSHDAR